MLRILVLGGGLVGSAIASDLASDTVRILAGEADLVIGDLPGFMGFSVLRAVIEAGRNIVDISFFPKTGRSASDVPLR